MVKVPDIDDAAIGMVVAINEIDRKLSVENFFVKPDNERQLCLEKARLIFRLVKLMEVNDGE